MCESQEGKFETDKRKGGKEEKKKKDGKKRRKKKAPREKEETIGRSSVVFVQYVCGAREHLSMCVRWRPSDHVCILYDWAR